MIVKSPNIVCRLEERKHPAEKPAIEFINNIFNPIGRLEKQIAEIEKKVDVMLLKGNDNNNDNHESQSLDGIHYKMEKEVTVIKTAVLMRGGEE